VNLAQQAVHEANRKVPVKVTVVSIEGSILTEDWL
jgi:hypothetical protein